MASSEMLAIVGMAMKASIRDAFTMFSPVSTLKYSCNTGATTTMPKKPTMTEGIDAIISTTGLTISLTSGFAICERYTAMARLSGTAIAEAISVVNMEATIRGNAPNRAGVPVGYQAVPKRNSPTPIMLKIGSPSLIRKNMIRKRINMLENPMKRKRFFINESYMMLLCFFRATMPTLFSLLITRYELM